MSIISFAIFEENAGVSRNVRVADF